MNREQPTIEASSKGTQALWLGVATIVIPTVFWSALDRFMTIAILPIVIGVGMIVFAAFVLAYESDASFAKTIKRFPIPFWPVKKIFEYADFLAFLMALAGFASPWAIWYARISLLTLT